jgi:ketosteroid isomerase-like protein
MRGAALAVLAVPAVLAACAAGPGSKPSASEDGVAVSAIVEFYEQWFEALESGNAEATLRLLDDDFALKPPVGPPITDRVVLRKALERMHQSTRQEIDWRIEDSGIHEDWAWARISEIAAHIPKAGGDSRIYRGSHLSILRRSKSGWRLYRDQASLDQIPAAH